MKLALFIAVLIPSSAALVFPKEALKKAASIATISAALSLNPLSGNAFDFSGSYSDPNHPNCQRVIKQSGSNALLKGTDGNPGCPADGSGKAWELSGKVDGESILIDFQPKGGPKDLKGVWEAKNKGIRFPDGNLWSLKN